MRHPRPTSASGCGKGCTDINFASGAASAACRYDYPLIHIHNNSDNGNTTERGACGARIPGCSSGIEQAEQGVRLRNGAESPDGGFHVGDTRGERLSGAYVPLSDQYVTGSVFRAVPPSVRQSLPYRVRLFPVGCKLVDTKELDEVKHSGQKNYNYENTKSPIHIVEELRLISSWVEKIETELVSGGIDKVIMVSDHGASRLAVINESETSLEVSEKGLHSGRCCPKADVSVKPDCATEENGFWCLANYDRFKGGRKANVEVHGGASLEEVAVPIVEITKVGKAIECNVCADSKVVTVSFKKKAELRLFVAEDSENVAIAIGGKIYQAEKTESKFYYKIPLPDIKKVGNYDFEVHVNGNVIKRGLSFEVKKEGATERKFF